MGNGWRIERADLSFHEKLRDEHGDPIDRGHDINPACQFHRSSLPGGRKSLQTGKAISTHRTQGPAELACKRGPARRPKG
ncbi:hypothetical protein M2A_2422 [Tepidicaulis marinus]|uniref:Uncharacterized protein n=1 Tax=Tepidicaulis marinus TaxID=1333998 RepID=A0A081BD05_9HYPH|nr:hypothetical protein M2A_2422 [Tepidicaulis marinus]